MLEATNPEGSQNIYPPLLTISPLRGGFLGRNTRRKRQQRARGFSVANIATFFLDFCCLGDYLTVSSCRAIFHARIPEYYDISNTSPPPNYCRPWYCRSHLRSSRS